MEDVAFKAKLDSIFEGLTEGIVILNRHGKLTYSNTRAQKLLGLKAGCILSRSHKESTSNTTELARNPLLSEDRFFKELIEAAKPVYGVEHKVNLSNGRKLRLSFNAAPIHDGSGSPIGVIVSFTDRSVERTSAFGELAAIALLNRLTLSSVIDERDRIKKALRDSEKRYRTLFDSAMDAIFVLEAEGENAGKILAANRAAADMNGYTVDELLTMNIKDLDTTEYADDVPENIKRILDGEKLRIETMHRRKDGTVFPVEAHAVLLELEKRKYILAFDRDITENKKAIELSNALNEINAAISSTLDFDEIMQRVVVEAARAMGAETSAIALRDGDCWHVKFLHGQMKQLAGARLDDKTAKGMVAAASTGKLVVVNDALRDERVNHEMMKKMGIRSVMVVPLMIKDEAIGILFFTYHSAEIAFTDAQIDFASKLGASVSLALENARLYQAKRNIADTLQEALLIMPGNLPGVDFAHLYRSATESARVGGDFYDLFEIDENRVGIVMGDISGKGLEAATLTSLVKSTIRIYAYDDYSPASVMKKVNDVVRKFCPLYSFVTAFFCILDVKTGRLTYCNAGHPPAYVKQQASGLQFLATCSPIIGAFPEFDYVAGETVLEKGDALILYTDGITEARCDDGFFGDERLVELIDKLTYFEVKDIPEAIFDEVIKFTGGPLTDDIALLSIILRDD